MEGVKNDCTVPITALIVSSSLFVHSLPGISGGPARGSFTGATLVAHASLNEFDSFVPLLLQICFGNFSVSASS